MLVHESQARSIQKTWATTPLTTPSRSRYNVLRAATWTLYCHWGVDRGTEPLSARLHKPWCWPGACSKQPEGTWRESWRVLEAGPGYGMGSAAFQDVRAEGLVRAIGLCDVDLDLFREVLEWARWGG